MDSLSQKGEVLILINSDHSIKNYELSNSINQDAQQAFKKLKIDSQFVQKINLMQNSFPDSQVTKESSSIQEYNKYLLTDFDKKFDLEQLKNFSQQKSNLEILQNLQRKINKNSHIKIQCKTEFPLVRSVAVQQFGWSVMSKQNHRQLVDLIWTDTYVSEQLVNRIRPYQKINHFPFSIQMGRKDNLFQNLNKMKSIRKGDYNYFAQTWVFPQDFNKFKKDTAIDQGSKGKFYIVKPVASCQGKGIYLAKKEDILMHTSQNKLLVQEYIENTMLIDGLKFDIRIYVLLKSLEPLQIYVYKQGLTRLATNQYQKPNEQNYRNGRMHLTNYAINKNNPCFVHNIDFRQDNIGHKRSLASFYAEIKKLGHDPQLIQQKIDNIIVKTVIAVYEKMTNSQKMNPKTSSPLKRQANNSSSNKKNQLNPVKKQIKTQRLIESQNKQGKSKKLGKCFQLLGFDIMIDEKLEPKLIQINHQPSLSSSSPLDHVIKKCLLIDVFNLLNLNPKEKQNYLQTKKDIHPASDLGCIIGKSTRKQQCIRRQIIFQDIPKLGGFRCIYPVKNKESMQNYHRILPLLKKAFNQQFRLRQENFSFRNTFQLNESPRKKHFNQNFSIRLNKTSFGQKRIPYDKNHIDIVSNPSSINFNKIQNGKQEKTIFNQETIHNNEIFQQTHQVRIIHQKGSQFNPFHVMPRIKAKKMTEFQVAKKNLSFTIKYNKNKSQPKQIYDQTQKTDSNNHSHRIIHTNQLQNLGHLSFYTNKQKLSQTKMNSLQMEFSQDPGNIKKVQKINKNQISFRHTSHQNRHPINITHLRNNQYNNFQNEQSLRFKKQSKQVQKYQYPIFQKRISTINSKSARQRPESLAQTQPIRKSNLFFQKIYEKELLTRITKIKSMKQKLQILNKKKQAENQIQSLTFNQNNLKQKHIIGLSNQQVQSPTSNFKDENKKTIYQTIQLMEFQEPKSRRISHVRMQKSINLKQRFNSSTQMFKDEGFFTHKKNIFVK